MRKETKMKLIPALLLVAFSGAASASGFALQNQTGSGNGNAFAGAAASAEDAGTIFFNPAGMTYLQEGSSISLSGTALQRSIKYSDTGTTGGINTIYGRPVGDSGGDAGGVALLPALYYSYAISPALRVGLGISPTFGNKTEYGTSFAGRYSGFFAEMEQININPSIAYRVNDMISLGAGINYAHNKTEFKQYVVTGLATDTVSDLKGSANAWGYNLGLMVQVSPSTRLGLTYRSNLKFKLKGAETGVFNRDITAELEMPDTISAAVSQKLSDKWEMLGDVTWTGWSSVNRIPVLSAATGAQLTSLSYNFKDTYRVGLGANYQLNDAWKLRFGVAYDQAPVKSSADRTMTLPDSNRTWLSIGAKLALSKAASVDFGYTHIFFADTSTERVVTPSAPGGTQTVRGSWSNSVNILSAQYNQSF